jgi:hypothetical protein
MLTIGARGQIFLVAEVEEESAAKEEKDEWKWERTRRGRGAECFMDRMVVGGPARPNWALVPEGSRGRPG